ncbi:MAG TPA: methionine/alanine import family NSS transporter small subunit [Nocardioides sp.]|nr:methionine/alanine import family NSS transporter small subunit [Nocardioides sp.]
MSTSAIVMMLIAMLVLWGGLAVSIWNINRFQGEEPEQVHRDL